MSAVFGKREWLNQHPSSAHILALIDNEMYWDTEITIADCTRTVTLSFSTATEDDYNNNVEKLRILISTLTDYLEMYKYQYPIALELRKDKEKKEIADAKELQDIFDGKIIL